MELNQNSSPVGPGGESKADLLSLNQRERFSTVDYLFFFCTKKGRAMKASLGIKGYFQLPF
jgi:hypothetical protein